MMLILSTDEGKFTFQTTWLYF